MILIKSKKQIILEGRYDSFTRIISNDIFRSIKETEGDLEHTHQIDLPYDVNGEERYGHESGLGVEVDLIIERTDNTILYGNRELPYYIKTYVDTDDVVDMEVTIDETYGRNFYEEMFYKINEDVRHELEHHLQNIFDDRQQPIQDTVNYETVFAHHMDPSEVEALVRGFHRRAKLEKKPLDIVMLEDIKKEIMDGNITADEGDTLLQTWLTYAVKNISKFEVSSATRRRFSLKK
jgi:hypothetical protein